MLNANAAIAASGTTKTSGNLWETSAVAATSRGAFVMQIGRTYAWLVLAGYCCLALAIPAATPAPNKIGALPPIAPLALANNTDDDAMMVPLRLEAMAALSDLQARHVH